MARRRVDLDGVLEGTDSATKEWWRALQEIPLKLTICAEREVSPSGVFWIMAQGEVKGSGPPQEVVLVFEPVSGHVFEALHGTLRFMRDAIKMDFKQSVGLLVFCNLYAAEQHSPSSEQALPSRALRSPGHTRMVERLTSNFPLFTLGGLLETWNDQNPWYNGVAGISPERFGEFDYLCLPPRYSDRGRNSKGPSTDAEEPARAGKSPPGVERGAADKRPSPQEVSGTERPNSLTKDGASWKLVFNGVAYKGIGLVVGMHYIAQCLSATEGEWLDPASMMLRAGRRPSKEQSVSSGDSGMAIAEGLSIAKGFDRTDAPDATAVRNYGKRLTRIREEKDEIEVARSERPGNDMLDAERAQLEALEEEEKQLKAQMVAAKKRQAGGPTESGAMKKNVEAVWAGVKHALRLIGALDAGKFEVFYKAHVKRESYRFRYQRDKKAPKEWVVDFGDGGGGGSGRSG